MKQAQDQNAGELERTEVTEINQDDLRIDSDSRLDFQKNSPGAGEAYQAQDGNLRSQTKWSKNQTLERATKQGKKMGWIC